MATIEYLHYYPQAKRFILKWDDSDQSRQIDERDVPETLLSQLISKLMTLRTVEERNLEEAKQAEEEAKALAKEKEQERAEAEAETERVRETAQKELDALQEKLTEANRRIAGLLTGNPTQEATEELILLYPEWQEGLSVDEGDAYRVGNVLYIATRSHLTEKENSPTSDQADAYWKGGAIQEEAEEPPAEFKYAKGTVVTYEGVKYYATEDTNDGPEVGYPTWDLYTNEKDD